MKHLGLVLRWSWRDLRAHWAKVIAIALIIAIGTGGYAGLTSSANWRRTSYDVSFETLGMFDVRVELATGARMAEGALVDVVEGIQHATWVEAVEERLIVPTQVEATGADGAVLVRGEIVGSDFADGGPHVNGYQAVRGRLIDPVSDAVMIDRNFSRFHNLADTGTIRLSGERELSYVGQATTPGYFVTAPEGEVFMSEATFAGVFATLETAQALAGEPGTVNDAVITLADGADLDLFVAELEAAAPTGVTVTTREDDLAYQMLTTDVDNDQQMFNALAFLLFAGAVGAAVNLVHRLAEEQRREIGISMALGIPRRWIAVRPLLVSAQIALLGAVFGVGVGILIGNAIGGVMESFVALPVWETPFQMGVFAGVAIAGVILPFAATALPVWRAVRVPPIDAIKPSHLSVGRGRSGSRRLRGDTFRVMPIRNMLRSKRRTIFTMLGIGAIVTVLVSFLGIMDSFVGALDDAEREAKGETPNRIVVSLNDFQPAQPIVGLISDADSVAHAEATLRLGASVAGNGEAIDLWVEFIDFDSAMWHPTIVDGSDGQAGGIVIAEKAATDLGVSPGDVITVRHPRATSSADFEFVESRIVVDGVHPYPIRNFAYMDQSQSSEIAAIPFVNVVNVEPRTGATVADVQRELFSVPAVASVQSVASATEALRDQMGALLGIIQVIVFGVLVLALLIAFNTASINLDARSREHATMFAFGVKVRTALRMATVESFIIGVVATVIGVVGGLAMLVWMTTALLADTVPDFGMSIVLQPTTIVAIVVLGILAVTLAPLLTVRRMRRMDLPGTLRLVE